MGKVSQKKTEFFFGSLPKNKLVKYVAKITPYNCDIRVGPNNLGLIFSKLRQCQKIPPAEVVCLGKLAWPSESDHFDPVPLKQNPNSSEAQSVLTKVSPADLSGQKCAQLTWRMSHTQMTMTMTITMTHVSYPNDPPKHNLESTCLKTSTVH